MVFKFTVKVSFLFEINCNVFWILSGSIMKSCFLLAIFALATADFSEANGLTQLDLDDGLWDVEEF